MKKAIFLLVFLSTTTYSQCPSANFSIPPSVCLNSNFEAIATVSNTASFSWDLCDGSLLNTPEVKIDIPTPGVTDPYDLKYVEQNGNHFSFVVSYSANRIFRFDHGTEITGLPAIVDLGDLGIVRPLGIGFFKEASLYFAVVVTESGKLYRLSFGVEVSSVPAVSEITGLTGLSDHRQMKIVHENGSVIAFVAGGNTTKVSVLNFGNSINNQPTQSFIQVPTGNILISIDFIAECNNKYLLVSTYGDGIYLLAFGNSLLNTPSITKPVSGGLRLGLSVVKSKGSYYAFAAAQSTGIDRIDFGPSITNPNPTVVNLGTFGGINFAIGHIIVKNGSRYYDVSMNYTGVYRVLEFSKDCDFGDDFSDTISPGLVKYVTPGTYALTLTAKGNNDEIFSTTKTITVSSVNAPVFDFNVSSKCQASATTFTPVVQTNESIASALWNFGDLASSADITPAHQYSSSGQYDVRLQATVSNGCQNIFKKKIKMYDPPIASFNTPAGLLCTNNEFIFVNNTPDNFEGNLSYQWFVDNQLQASDRDLKHTFVTTGIKAIKLVTSIPGCSDEITQMTSEVAAGPIVDFSFAGICKETITQFTSGISEPVTGYSWNFGDGNFSTAPSPQHLFAESNDYSVSLTATSPSGCNNSKTKTITIYSKPQPDFTVLPPPFSCSDVQTDFTNTTQDPTDSDIISWAWDFDDPGSENISNLQNPKHLFANDGTYAVSLATTTNAGCSSIVIKNIDILPSPTAVITHTSTCKNLPVNFVATGSDIQSYYWEMGTSYYLTDKPVHTFNTTSDQTVKLTLTGNNNCVTVYTKIITIPIPLSPDFSVTKNCVGYDALFTDVTTGYDPVTTRKWTFPGDVISTSSPSIEFPFNSSGNKEINLQVTTQSGCTYATTKNVNVVPAPKANFTAAPASGATPLKVQFNNASTYATAYTWSFPDGVVTTSTQVSPSFTFQELGEHNVELVASNNEGCSDKVSKVITVETPLPDVDLKLISTTENQDGSLKVIITIHNKGNTILENLPVEINISDNVSLREIIKEPIAPSSMYNLVLSYGLTKTHNLKFLCAEADLENDQATDGNRICTEFQNSTFIFSSYPNPAEKELKIEWIANKDQRINIFLADGFGKEILKSEILSAEGLNQEIFNVEKLQSGIYFLIINDGFVRKTQRISILPKN